MNDVERAFLLDQASDIVASTRNILDLVQAFQTLRFDGPAATLSEVVDRLQSNVSHIHYLISKES